MVARGGVRVAAISSVTSSASRVSRGRASRVSANASAETRRFGIGRGSSATYRENAPTTYEDGVADELAHHSEIGCHDRQASQEVLPELGGQRETVISRRTMRCQSDIRSAQV